MTSTSILCRCGQHLRVRDRKQMVSKCPSCGRKVDYLSDDLPVKSLDRKAYKRLLRETDEEPNSSDTRVSIKEISVATFQLALANVFWVVSGLCITSVLGLCLYFFSQTFDPSEAQLNYEMAIEMRAEGRQKEARMLLEQIVEQSPRSRWARQAQNLLADMPGVGLKFDVATAAN